MNTICFFSKKINKKHWKSDPYLALHVSALWLFIVDRWSDAGGILIRQVLYCRQVLLKVIWCTVLSQSAEFMLTSNMAFNWDVVAGQLFVAEYAFVHNMREFFLTLVVVVKLPAVILHPRNAVILPSTLDAFIEALVIPMCWTIRKPFLILPICNRIHHFLQDGPDYPCVIFSVLTLIFRRQRPVSFDLRYKLT